MQDNYNKLEDYQERYLNEYKELKEKTKKLGAILIKDINNELNFKLNCPRELLTEQYFIMLDYLKVLEKRAIFESLKIEE